MSEGGASSFWKRVGPLAAATALLFGAGVQLRVGDGAADSLNTLFAIMLVSAGLIVMGSWLTVEVWHHHDVGRKPDYTDIDQPTGPTLSKDEGA